MAARQLNLALHPRLLLRTLLQQIALRLYHVRPYRPPVPVGRLLEQVLDLLEAVDVLAESFEVASFFLADGVGSDIGGAESALEQPSRTVRAVAGRGSGRLSFGEVGRLLGGASGQG